MALSSARFEGVVNPASGIFVEMEGIMQVEYTADNPNFIKPPEDLFSFQQRNRRIPKEFCLKDKKQGGRQAVFQCLVCEGSGPLKSILPLQHHVVGKKHIRKACEAKRRLMGIPKPSSVIEKKKKVPKSPPKKNVNLSLQTKLERSGQPALGLEYITEFLHPEKLEKDHPMYSCSLEGCKSAWGTSFEIFHHVLNVKHQRNFLKSVNPDDATIGDMLKPDVFLKALQWDEQNFPNGEKDYSKIVQVIDHEQYMEMRERRPGKPWEGEKVWETEGRMEKVLETGGRVPEEYNDCSKQVPTKRGRFNGVDHDNNIIPDGSIGSVSGGCEDRVPNLEEMTAPEKMDEYNLVTDAFETT